MNFSRLFGARTEKEGGAPAGGALQRRGGTTPISMNARMQPAQQYPHPRSSPYMSLCAYADCLSALTLLALREANTRASKPVPRSTPSQR